MDRYVELEYNDGSDANKTVQIHQDTSIGVGGCIWDAAIQLTYYLMKQYNTPHYTSKLSNQSICALSCGTGLEAIAVACFENIHNSRFILTDIDQHVKLMQHNIDLNKHLINDTNTISASEYFWGDGTTPLNPTENGKFDIIIIADILYRPELYNQLLSSLQSLSRHGTILYMCNEVRQQVEHPLYMTQFYDKMKQLFNMQRIDSTELHSDYQCDTIELYKCRLL